MAWGLLKFPSNVFTCSFSIILEILIVGLKSFARSMTSPFDIISLRYLASCLKVSGCPQLFVNNLLNTRSLLKLRSIHFEVSCGMRDVILVLASSSPNRLRLIKQMGFENAIVRVSNFEENLPKTLPVEEFVVETARGKLLTIVEEMKKKHEKYDVIVACDTVIQFEGEIIGKPTDADDAFKTLQRLRNNSHNVYSGVVCHYGKTDETEAFWEKTVVHFGDIPDRIIQYYVQSGEPMNKAGSYGIGEFGGVFVRSVEGCLPNVRGLPIHRLYTSFINRNII